MAIYMLLINIKNNGKITPAERVRGIEAIIEAHDGADSEFAAQYECLGNFDVVDIIATNREKTINQIAAELVNSGMIHNLELMGPYETHRYDCFHFDELSKKEPALAGMAG